jgi:hypothetical protein
LVLVDTGITSEGVAVGNTGMPAKAIMHTLLPIGNTGVEGCVEIAPILSNRICNMIGTMDIDTVA